MAKPSSRLDWRLRFVGTCVLALFAFSLAAALVDTFIPEPRWVSSVLTAVLFTVAGLSLTQRWQTLVKRNRGGDAQVGASSLSDD